VFGEAYAAGEGEDGCVCATVLYAEAFTVFDEKLQHGLSFFSFRLKLFRVRGSTVTSSLLHQGERHVATDRKRL